MPVLGKYHCPVTYKVFNANTKIVAIKTTGNVYCNEVIIKLTPFGIPILYNNLFDLRNNVI